MNGLMRRLMLVGACALPSLTAGCLGGERYQQLVDPCYPQRYNAQARAEVVASFAPQVQNGHVLDQTIWNYHFEAGTDKLHPGGADKLVYLIRRRPQPDGRLFLQTAHDIAYDGTSDPEKFANSRRELDHKRRLTIERYIAAETSGRPMFFEVLVHDPAETGINANSALLSSRRNVAGSRGVLSTGGTSGQGGLSSGGGGSGTGTGGAAGGGSGGSGGSTGSSGGTRY